MQHKIFFYHILQPVVSLDPADIRQVVEMGFSESKARAALQVSAICNLIYPFSLYLTTLYVTSNMAISTVQ
jgi:hypothetical protein